MTDAVVTMHPTPVMYVSGNRSAPISEQAPAAIDQIQAKLPSLHGRRRYGVVIGDEYRACVTILPGDDPVEWELSAWELPGGEYVRSKLLEFHSKAHLIRTIINKLMQREDYDSTRPPVEYYRSHPELFLMVPVKP